MILTTDQIKRADEDLRTIDALNTFANAKSLELEISGGYATDSHLGTEILRPHGDIDAIIWFTSERPERIEDEIVSLLEEESTKWAVHSKKSEFLELREDNDNVSDFSSKRRLELYILFNRGDRDLVTKSLIDSSGNRHNFLVLELNKFTTDKIDKVLERNRQSIDEREKGGFRDTQESDKQDLIKLISSSAFDKKQAKTNLTEKDWQKAMDIIGYSQQGSL